MKLLLLVALLALVPSPAARADARRENYQAANTDPELLVRLEDLQATMVQFGERPPPLERPFAVDLTSEILPKKDRNYILVGTTGAKVGAGNLFFLSQFTTGEVEAEVRYAAEESMRGYRFSAAEKGIELVPITDLEHQWPRSEFFQFRKDGVSVGNLARIGEGRYSLIVMFVGIGFGFEDSKHINALLSRKAGALLAFKPEYRGTPVR